MASLGSTVKTLQTDVSDLKTFKTKMEQEHSSLAKELQALKVSFTRCGPHRWLLLRLFHPLCTSMVIIISSVSPVVVPIVIIALSVHPFWTPIETIVLTISPVVDLIIVYCFPGQCHIVTTIYYRQPVSIGRQTHNKKRESIWVVLSDHILKLRIILALWIASIICKTQFDLFD